MGSTRTPEPPREIMAMPYRRCPMCGNDGMHDQTTRRNQRFYCGRCDETYQAACPNEEQLETAIAVLRPLGKGHRLYSQGRTPGAERRELERSELPFRMRLDRQVVNRDVDDSE